MNELTNQQISSVSGGFDSKDPQSQATLAGGAVGGLVGFAITISPDPLSRIVSGVACAGLGAVAGYYLYELHDQQQEKDNNFELEVNI